MYGGALCASDVGSGRASRPARRPDARRTEIAGAPSTVSASEMSEPPLSVRISWCTCVRAALSSRRRETTHASRVSDASDAIASASKYGASGV